MLSSRTIGGESGSARGSKDAGGFVSIIAPLRRGRRDDGGGALGVTVRAGGTFGPGKSNVNDAGAGDGRGEATGALGGAMGSRGGNGGTDSGARGGVVVAGRCAGIDREGRVPCAEGGVMLAGTRTTSSDGIEGGVMLAGTRTTSSVACASGRGGAVVLVWRPVSISRSGGSRNAGPIGIGAAGSSAAGGGDSSRGVGA
jgi:hypothetical protein